MVTNFYLRLYNVMYYERDSIPIQSIFHFKQLLFISCIEKVFSMFLSVFRHVFDSIWNELIPSEGTCTSGSELLP